MLPAHITIERGCEEPRKSSYLVRHFRGEFTLQIAFWRNYLGSTVFFTLTGFVIWKLGYVISFVTCSALILAYLITLPIGQIFFMIGTWRSASRHVERGGKRVCALLAKSILLIGFYSIGNLLIYQILPVTLDLGGDLLRDKKKLGYVISVYNFTNGAGISFQGRLEAGADVEFNNKLSQTPRAKLVRIESYGGRILVGMRIGRMIRDAGLTTIAGNHCESAATLVFMSGKKRLISSSAKIGFHRPSGKWSSFGNDDDDHTSLRTFMEQAGVSNNFIDRVISTSPDDMWYPTFEEMLKAGVVTVRWTPKTRPPVKMDFRRSAGEEKADYESKTQTA